MCQSSSSVTYLALINNKLMCILYIFACFVKANDTYSDVHASYAHGA